MIIKPKFQYISCCSLSINVTAYDNMVLAFQYISCCSLSMRPLITEYLTHEFQYISCCSLSNPRNFSVTSSFLFQYISCCSLSLKTLCATQEGHCFNTSHVVVYLIRIILCYQLVQVSIHLMLQFIDNNSGQDKELYLFQYISCCSLSCSKHSGTSGKFVSIHLMLQFICYF